MKESRKNLVPSGYIDHKIFNKFNSSGIIAQIMYILPKTPAIVANGAMVNSFYHKLSKFIAKALYLVRNHVGRCMEKYTFSFVEIIFRLNLAHKALAFLDVNYEYENNLRLVSRYMSWTLYSECALLMWYSFSLEAIIDKSTEWR